MGFIGQTWKKIAINTPEDVRLAKDTDRLKTCKRKNYMKSLNLGHSEIGQLKQLEKYILLPAPSSSVLKRNRKKPKHSWKNLQIPLPWPTGYKSSHTWNPDEIRRLIAGATPIHITPYFLSNGRFEEIRMLISCSHPTNIPKKIKLKEEPYASYIDGFLEGWWILMQTSRNSST